MLTTDERFEMRVMRWFGIALVAFFAAAVSTMATGTTAGGSHWASASAAANPSRAVGPAPHTLARRG